MDVTIIYCDEHLLAINKPAGLPTLPDGYDRSAPHVKSLLEPGYGRLWIVHRLDKDTSGALALARSAAAHQALNTQFDGRLVSKVYHAMVVGSPEWESTTLDAPLKPDGDRRHRTVIHPQGKPAITHLRVLERLGEYTLVEAVPETGRTHQIRAHLASAGLPIAADDLYGGQLPPGSLPLARCGLHAYSLTISHPISGETLQFIAPYPDDFRAALEGLRKI